VVAAVTATRRIRVAPLVWMIAAVLSVVAALVWPAGPLIVGGVKGEPFEIGPLPPGWSIRQTLRPEPAPELFVGFKARPTANMESAPTLEVRLERDDQVLWADRVRVIGDGMREYVATFAVPTDGMDYRMVVRVLEAQGGGVVLAGVDIGEPTATTQLTIMEQPLRGFLALGHRTFQRVPPVRHLEEVSTAVEQWTVVAAAAAAVLTALGGAVAAVLLGRTYGGSIAVITATVGLASLVIWLYVAAVHLSVPLDTEAQIGVLRGLTPTGTAALLAFPFVVVLGVAAILVKAPRATLDSASSVARGLWMATVTAIRHWYLAPIPLGGAAAAAVTQDALEVATALATLTGAWALLAAAAVPTVSRLRGDRLADEEVLERKKGEVTIE